MSAECLNGGCLSGLETEESFCLQWDLIFVDSGIIECYKLCSLPMPSPVISKNTLHGPTPHHHLSNCSVYTRKKSWIVCMGEKEWSTSAAKFAPTWAQIEKVHDSDKLHPRCCDILNNTGRKVGSPGRGGGISDFFQVGGLKVQNA